MKKVLAPDDIAHFVTDWHLAPVLDTGDFVFFSGVTGAHPDLTVAGDPETQFRDTFAFLKANLEVAGLGFDDVVDLTTYHVDLRRHLDVFIKVKDTFVHEPYPAWTAIGVTDLITEGTLVEIRAIAKRQQVPKIVHDLIDKHPVTIGHGLDGLAGIGVAGRVRATVLR